jgi:hypothetical protein
MIYDIYITLLNTISMNPQQNLSHAYYNQAQHHL